MDVASGLIGTARYQCCRRPFLDLANDHVPHYPDQADHVFLAHRNTHKPNRDHWLVRHPNFRFHVTPTYASWLNQVELRFR